MIDKPQSEQVRIAVVGSLNMDLVFNTSRMPALGETVMGQEFHQIPGGKGANQAVAAARQGGAVSMIGCLGDDAFGRQLLAGLIDDGVDVSHVKRQANMATGVAGILVDGEGRNSIVVTPGANHMLDVNDINEAVSVIKTAHALVCQLETPLNTISHAIALAHENGVPVIFNPSPVQPLSDTLLGMVDYLIVNETEAAQLSGVPVTDNDSAARAAARLLERGCGTVLLTMGAHGVFVAAKGLAQYFPAVQVKAVDTTAAGDTFAGAFAVAVTQGLDTCSAGMKAQYAAALAVTRPGAQTSIPDAHDVRAFALSLGGDR